MKNESYRELIISYNIWLQIMLILALRLLSSTMELPGLKKTVVVVFIIISSRRLSLYLEVKNYFRCKSKSTLGIKFLYVFIMLYR